MKNNADALITKFMLAILFLRENKLLCSDTRNSLSFIVRFFAMNRSDMRINMQYVFSKPLSFF